MPLPPVSLDKLHAATVEACMVYQRAAKKRGLRLEKITITYEPRGKGFDIKIAEVPYPKKDGFWIVPLEDRDAPGEDIPIEEAKD